MLPGTPLLHSLCAAAAFPSGDCGRPPTHRSGAQGHCIVLRVCLRSLFPFFHLGYRLAAPALLDHSIVAISTASGGY